MDTAEIDMTQGTARQPSILVVEDEVIVSLDIQQKLKRLGYDIADSAVTGREAVDMAARTHPDLVLMDIRLKGDMDGIEAARLIGAKTGTPVVFLTAYGDEETVERVKAADPFGYLLKPIEDNNLRTMVEVALHRHRSDRALVEAHEALKRAHADLERQVERATAIGNLGLDALGGAEFEQLARTALPLVMRLLPADAAAVLRSEAAGFAAAAAAGPVSGAADGTRAAPSWPVLSEAIRSPGPVRYTDAGGKAAARFPNDDGMPVGDGLLVRVDGYQAPWGVLVALCTERGAFGDNDVHFIQSIANVLGMSMKALQIEDAMLQLSTPVMSLADGFLLVPLIGTLDPKRTRHLSSVLLNEVRARKARVVVLDVTGLAQIDARSANDIVQVVDAVAVLGAKVLLSGISPRFSTTLVKLAVPLGRIGTVGDLRSAIEQGTRLLAR